MSEARSVRTAPLMLATSVECVAGLTVNASSVDLTAPFRQAHWIDSVCWTAAGVSESNTDFWNWGGTIRTRMMLGRTELTRARSNGFVPIWSLSPQVNDPIASVSFDRSSAEQRWATCSYKWKFPRPLYVPPGMSLQSEFFRTDDGGPGTVDVTVAYAGRYADRNAPTLQESDVPFATFAEAVAGASSYMSDENDFVNPFLVPLHCQRFIGRAQEHHADNYLTESRQGMQSKVTIDDSYGNTIVRDPVTSGSMLVFDYNRRAWTFNKILDPKERYNVQLLPDAIVLDAAASTFVCDQHISLIGWRKERFS